MNGDWLRASLSRKPTDRVRQLARRWQPYSGFLYFHLLLQSLAEAGRLTPAALASRA